MAAGVVKTFENTEIIFEIHRLQFGVLYDQSVVEIREAFVKTLTAFSASNQGVTAGTIRNWLAATPREPNANGRRFLLRYLKHLISDQLVAAGMEADAAAFHRFLQETVPERRVTEGKRVDVANNADSAVDRIVMDRLGHLFRASRANNRSITNDLFHNGDPHDNTDWSYFFVYRYSTNRGELLKSLLVVQKPDSAFRDFGFNHFVWGGKEKGQNRNVFRECEGAVLALERAYYFLGYNFVVGANKRTSDVTLYEKARRVAKRHPNGMGLLSAEYEEITRDAGLFSGVTMTIAAGHQPVVARIAFLHIGTKTGLGHGLSDRDVDLRELEADKLAADLKSTVHRLSRKHACKRFGIHLQDAIAEKNWRTKGATALADRILEMIDNTPAWEIAQSVPVARRSNKAKPPRKPVARGALETFGPGRPRE